MEKTNPNVDWLNPKLVLRPTKNRPTRHESYYKHICPSCGARRWLRATEAQKTKLCANCQRKAASKNLESVNVIPDRAKVDAVAIGAQMSFPELTSYLSTTKTAVGVAGEVMIAQALQRSGYAVSLKHKRADIEVYLPNGREIFIEVKAARRAVDGKYRFTLVKENSTDHRNADIVILVCILKTGRAVPFVVPVSALYDQRQAVISSYPTDYQGKLAQYRQKISNVRLEAAIKEVFE